MCIRDRLSVALPNLYKRLLCAVGVLIFEVGNERDLGPVLVIDLVPSHRVFIVRDAPDEPPRNR
eukprot:10935546-Prorocentrum_lima.AAC.1